MNGDSGNRTPETMANRSPDDRCVWTRMPDDEQRWMQPVRFYLACADEIARGRYPFYPDNCPQCGKPVVIHSENGEPVKSEAVTSNGQLYTCSCAEYYGSHHPECPARQQFDRQRAEIERLRAALETAAKRFDYIAASAVTPAYSYRPQRPADRPRQP